MATEWREDPAGMARLLATPAAVKAAEHIGEIVRIEAERIAPVRTGAYAFGVEAPNGAHGGGFTVEPFVRDRAAAVRVVNRVRSKPSHKYPDGFGYGVVLEIGSRYQHAQHILGRALDALNLL